MVCPCCSVELLKPLHGKADSSFPAQSAASAFPLGLLGAQDFLVQKLLSMLCQIKRSLAHGHLLTWMDIHILKILNKWLVQI